MSARCLILSMSGCRCWTRHFQTARHRARRTFVLLIDQFEEVFKPKVSAAGCKMVMSLITSIHTYRPANLFLIITMRSEELHRCSEFIGVTEVVNSSMYLVDLIGGRDIEQAIVGAGAARAQVVGPRSGRPGNGPYTRRALSRLHQVFDDGREALPHPADQLPLMQHLLPLVWDKAIERWEAPTTAARRSRSTWRTSRRCLVGRRRKVR